MEKVLKQIPTEKHLARLYFELSKRGAPCIGRKLPWPYHPKNREGLFCLASEMSRHDPRLITILVRWVIDAWREMNPTLIRTNFDKMQTPQTVAVISAFASEGGDDQELRHFCLYLQSGIKPTPLQFYFHHLYPPAGYLARRAALSPLQEYKKWGFLACEAPTLDDRRRTTGGRLDPPSRHNILNNLINDKREIRLRDYIAACGGKISRQQALLDLKGVGYLTTQGAGRGAIWHTQT